MTPNPKEITSNPKKITPDTTEMTSDPKEMTPNPDYNYPRLYAEASIEEKRAKAEELFSEYSSGDIFPREYLDSPERIESLCQGDFKLCSLLAYKVAAWIFEQPEAQAFDFKLFCRNNQAFFVPVRYCGGDMCFGRVFAINHCAFSSPDSIVGFRDAERSWPQEYFKVAKGLRYVGTHDNWSLFKLDGSSTDDMTGVLYSPLEKNFTIEFAHFPHDGEPKVLFRWVDR